MPELVTPGRYIFEWGVQIFTTPAGYHFTKKAVDLDGNGYSDLIIADGVFPPETIRDTTGHIVFQDENGFYLSDTDFPGREHPANIYVADLNGDDLSDIFVAASGYDAPPFAGESSALLLSSNGSYQESQTSIFLSSGFTHSGALGDVDGDGDIDILSGNQPNLRMQLNDGTGQFSASEDLLPSEVLGVDPEFNATTVHIHDIDGDGNNDLFFGSSDTSEYPGLYVYFGEENSAYSNERLLILQDESDLGKNHIVLSIATFDIDLDGDDDLVTSFTQRDPSYVGNGFQVFRNDGNRVFTDITKFSLGELSFQEDVRWVRNQFVIDFNSDGVKDIFLERNGVGGSPQDALVLLGDGGGRFTSITEQDVFADQTWLQNVMVPAEANGQVELLSGHYPTDDQLVVSRIRVDEPANVGLDPKINEYFFVGASSDDLLVGTNGDDVLIGGTGDDSIDGADGVDTAQFSGEQNSYTVQLSSNSVVVDDRRDFGYGRDELLSVERLEFIEDESSSPLNLSVFGGATSLSQTDFESFIELYIAYFNRSPDALGLNFWGTAFADGTTLEQMASLFVDQDETRETYPDGTSNTDFVTSVYDNVLGRIPDQAGFNFWIDMLNRSEVTGVTRDQFILEVLRGVPDGSSDRAFLDNKVDIGAYFAVHRGMSDVNNASASMALYDGSRASIDQAMAAIDSFYQEALDANNGEFLMQVVGVLDNPFAV